MRPARGSCERSLDPQRILRDKGTFFADVTGDGLADAIVVNNGGVVVRRSVGSRFTPNEVWTVGAYYGDKGTFFANVDGH